MCRAHGKAAPQTRSRRHPKNGGLLVDPSDDIDGWTTSCVGANSWRLKGPVIDAERVQAYRANALFDAHRADPEFGYRFLVEEARITGEPMVERTAWRICSAQGWWSAFGKKRGKNGKVGPPVHDDLVERDSPPRHQISCGWLILPSIRPQRASCVRSKTHSPTASSATAWLTVKSRLAVTALSNAVSRRGEVAGCILHTDRGSQGGFNRWSQHRLGEASVGVRRRLPQGFASRGSCVVGC